VVAPGRRVAAFGDLDEVDRVAGFHRYHIHHCTVVNMDVTHRNQSSWVPRMGATYLIVAL
jgi:hypothetical protein